VGGSEKHKQRWFKVQCGTMKRLSKRLGKEKKFKFEGFEEGDPSENFEFLECLGEGTYGSVYISEDKKARKLVALKIVPIDNDEEEIQQEIDIMRMCDSPNIVKCFSAYQSADTKQVWMTMEICEAGSVNDLMFVTDETMSEAQIREIAASATLGLAYLHEKRILHRDVKCGNILMNRVGEVKLADFGVSAVLLSKQERRTTAIGAPYWMAPEVISESPYDGRCDVWSLGIACIEAAEARPPNSHIHPMRAIFLIPQQDAPELDRPPFPKKDWSVDFRSFVSECLVMKHDKRSTAEQLLQHKFIQKTVKKLNAHKGKSSVMQKVVERTMPLIQEFRSLEDELDDEIVVDAEDVLARDIGTGERDGRTIIEMKPQVPEAKRKSKGFKKEKKRNTKKEQQKKKEEDKRESEKAKVVKEPSESATERHIAPLRPPSLAREEFKQYKTLKAQGADVSAESGVLNKSKQTHMGIDDIRDMLKPSQASSEDDVDEVVAAEQKRAIENFGSAVMTKHFIHLLKLAKEKEPRLFKILEKVDRPEEAIEVTIDMLKDFAGLTRKLANEE